MDDQLTGGAQKSSKDAVGNKGPVVPKKGFSRGKDTEKLDKALRAVLAHNEVAFPRQVVHPPV